VTEEVAQCERRQGTCRTLPAGCAYFRIPCTQVSAALAAQSVNQQVLCHSLMQDHTV